MSKSRVSSAESVRLRDFPSDVRDTYSILLPKMTALKVVIDEQMRNTRDIIEQRELTGTGLRPKTAAGIQLLLRGIITEIDSIKHNNQKWLQTKMAAINKHEVTQIKAILTDLERKLNERYTEIAEMKRMWEECVRTRKNRLKSSKGNRESLLGIPRMGSTESNQSIKRIKSSQRRSNLDNCDVISNHSNHSLSNHDDDGINMNKNQYFKNEDSRVPMDPELDKDVDKKDHSTNCSECDELPPQNLRLLRRESTLMLTTKQRANSIREKYITRGMTELQLRNYYRERSFMNAVARDGSMHADAEKRVLERLSPTKGNHELDSNPIGSNENLSSVSIATAANTVEDPIKPLRRQPTRYNYKLTAPLWTRRGSTVDLPEYRRDYTMGAAMHRRVQPMYKKNNNSYPHGSSFPDLPPLRMYKLRDRNNTFVKESQDNKKPRTI